MACEKSLVKKPEARSFQNIGQSARYVKFNKRIIPVQQLNRHLIIACQKMMNIGNDFDKAYCSVLLQKLRMTINELDFMHG